MQYEQVFIYGTLKRGFSNHRRLQVVGTFLKEVTTDDVFDLKMNFFPCLFKEPLTSNSSPKHIKGELWSVYKRKLKILDKFEGHPTLFKRGKIMVEGQEVWTYFYQGADIHGESLTEYIEPK